MAEKPHEIEEIVPETGYNLCSIEDMEKHGECLQLIKHFDSYEDATKERDERQASGANIVILSKHHSRKEE